MANLIITIDGPAASGKSTVAQLLAQKIKASFLDTGAMYRAATLAAMQARVDMSDEEELLGVLETTKFRFTVKEGKTVACINGVDVTEQIRGPQVTDNAKYIASAAKVRAKLVEMQRQFAKEHGKIVTEGRDQGTVAFPNADIKFYLTADVVERAGRRQAELQAKGNQETLEQIQRSIEERDKSDEDRTVGPLRPAEDAIVVDTTNLGIEQVVEKLLGYVDKKTEKEPGMIWFKVARWICRTLCNLFFRLQFYGLENVPQRGPFVLIGNHQSFLDPVLCGIYVKKPLYFLARDTLFVNWFFGWLISSVNTIPVRRDQADVTAIRKVIAKLKQGNAVCLFPEGTRTRDGKIAPLKPGFGLLCRRGGAAVVPVVVDGAYECWPRHKKIFSPGKTIAVCYGRALTAEQVRAMNDRELAECLTDTLRKMQNEFRAKHGKELYNYGM